MKHQQIIIMIFFIFYFSLSLASAQYIPPTDISITKPASTIQAEVTLTLITNYSSVSDWRTPSEKGIGWTVDIQVATESGDPQLFPGYYHEFFKHDPDNFHEEELHSTIINTNILLIMDTLQRGGVQ